MTAIKVGQVWREVDPRFTRHIRVEGFTADGRVRIVTTDKTGRMSVRRSTCRLDRFNGRRGGYELVRAAHREIAP